MAVEQSKEMETNHPQDRSASRLLFGLSALALGQALQANNGNINRTAIIWLTVSLLLAALGAIGVAIRFPAIPNWITWVVLGLGLAWQVRQLVTANPAYFILKSFTGKLWQFRALVLAAAALALLTLLTWKWRYTWLKASLFAGVILVLGAAGVWIIRASPNPFIDVYVFEQSSSQALIQGKNPYELTPPNIYGNMDFYGPALVKGDKLTIGNPYPPLSIYLSTLGYILTGDIRYAHLAAILLTGILIATMRRGRGALFGALIFIFTPRLFFVLEQSWTEPLVIFLAALVIWLALRRTSLTMIALGLLMVVKQYMLFLFPLIFLLMPPRASRPAWAKSLANIAAPAFLATAPLFFWNIPAFLWDVGFAQWKQVFRITSLSYAALIARTTGHQPTQLLPFIVLGALLLVFLLVRAFRSPAGYTVAMALCLGFFFAFSKQAFCNYYFLVVGLLCCCVAVLPQATEPASGG